MKLAGFQAYFAEHSTPPAGTSNSLILQRITTERGIFGGLIGLTSVTDIHEKRILPHEKILKSRFEEVAQKFLQSRTFNKPILLGYPEHAGLSSLAEDWARSHQIDFRIDSLGGEYVYWVVNDPQAVAKICSIFHEIPISYIADGHHRMGAIQYLHERNLLPSDILSALFSFKNLRINPYHRLVTIEESILTLSSRMETFLERIPERSTDEDLANHTLLMQYQEERVHFKWRKEVLERFGSDALDAQLFDQFLLREVFQISDATTSDRVAYFPDDRATEMKMALLGDPHAVGFFLPPVRPRQFMHSCEQSIMMPPKSTYFEPRMMSGHLHHKFPPDA